MTRTSRYVIVGASLAGLSAAETLRQQGLRARWSMVGEEPVLPYDRRPCPSRSFEASGSRSRHSSATTPTMQARCRVEAGAAGGRRLTSTRGAVILDNGESVAFDGLVIATGATPRRLPGCAGLEGVHVLRTLDDAMAIRAELEGGPRLRGRGWLHRGRGRRRVSRPGALT